MNVIIKKYGPSSFCWPNLIRKKNELSVLQILDTYQGFEGELIDILPIKEEIKNSNNILHVFSGEFLPSFLNNPAIKVGYDVGVCEEETTYSSIFNEILFGKLKELTDFKDLLNENLLFPDKSIAEKYICLHNTLSALGIDVEDYQKLNIYEIWKI